MKLAFLLLIGLHMYNLSVGQTDLDKPLIAILDSIYNEDQKYRLQMDEVEKKYSWDSKEMQALFQSMHEADSANVIVITRILDQRGWLGPEIVGKQGNATLFLVIQHADYTVQKKYLPMMRKAVKLGNASADDLALLEDRVAIRTGKKQKYGSQIGLDEITGEYYILPLKNPGNVNKRRAKVGLRPIEDYIANWNLTWNADEYKKKLPEIMAKQKTY